MPSQLLAALTSNDRVRRLLVEATEAREMLSDALDGVDRPVAIVDGRLGLRYANAAARSFLQEGSALRLGSGRLLATRPKADERLRTIVRKAIAPGGSGGVVALGWGKAADVVRVEPLRPGRAGMERPLALIVSNRRRPLDPVELRTIYGLTRREAEVALLFAEGLGIGDAAVRLCRSVNTVKTAARAIYAKLGVGGHAEAGVRIRIDLGA